MFILLRVQFLLNWSSPFYLFLLYLIAIPLLIGLSLEILYHYHLGIIWLCILFSYLPERLFQQDYEDGSLELYFLSSRSLQSLSFIQLISFWLFKISGILLCFPILSHAYNLEQSVLLYVTTILGSFAFTLILGIYSCLTLGIKSGIWNSLQHFTALPPLLPLIILCTSFQIYALIGFVMLFLWIFFVFVSITFETVLGK